MAFESWEIRGGQESEADEQSNAWDLDLREERVRNFGEVDAVDILENMEGGPQLSQVLAVHGFMFRF